VRKVKWTDAEDEMLLSYVEKYGTSNWSLIASGMPGRMGKQCRERWTNRLDPILNRDDWTPQEDAILLYQQKTCGNCWSRITGFLPRRSANAVKNRWCWLARHNVRVQDLGEVPSPKCETAQEHERPEPVQISLAEWIEALDLSGSPEWLRTDLCDAGSMETWTPWNQRDCVMENFEFASM
jgi:hypothetical protein